MAASRTRTQSMTLLDAVINFTLAGFLFIAAYAAYEGLFDIILAEQPSLASEQQRYYIAAAVTLITLAMWALLEVALRRGGAGKRIISAAFYLLLALWSIGFGYGFWWKVIASRSDTRAGIESSSRNVERQADSVEIAIRKVEGLLIGVISTSEAKKDQEIKAGGSCGIPSRPGEGPLAKRRAAVTSEIDTLRQSVEGDWIKPLRAIVDGASDNRTSNTPTLRQAQDSLAPKNMRELTQDQRMAVYEQARKSATAAISQIDILNRSQGAIFAARFSALAERLEQPADVRNECHDPELAKALRLAAKAATENPALTIPDFEINEGAAATVKAFNKIWNNVFWAFRSVAWSLGADIDVGQPETLAGKDIIALVASIAVDACIFVFAFIRTRRPLDAAYNFQSAHGGARAKLEAAIQSFASDDNLDARRVFNACVLRYGREHYFILPHLSSPMAPEWRPGAAFLQNILMVLEAVGAIEKSFEPSGIKAFLRAIVPWKNMRPQFERAAEQLKEFGWGVDEDAELEPRLLLSLHRFRQGDLLELLLIAREKKSQTQAIRTEVNRSPRAEPEPTSTGWTSSTLKAMGSSFQRFARTIRVPTKSTHRSHSQRDSDAEFAQGDGGEKVDLHTMKAATQKDVTFSNAAESVRNGDAFGMGEARPLVPFSDFLGGQAYEESQQNGERGSDSARIEQLDGDIHQSAGRKNAQTTELDRVFEAIDDLERAISVSRTNPDLAGQAQGLEMTASRLSGLLRVEGLDAIARVGDRFDPKFHNAIDMRVSDTEKGRIISIVSQGYRDRVSGRIVRDAQVVVSAGAAAQADAEEVTEV